MPSNLEPSWSVKITRGVNGYVLTYLEVLNDGALRRAHIAIEDPADGNEIQTFIKLVYEISEQFGIYNGFEIREKKDHES